MRDMTRYPEFTLGMDRDASRYSYRVLIANLSKKDNIDNNIVDFEEVTLSKVKIGISGNFLDLDSTFAVCGREILYLHTPMYHPDMNITIYVAEREQLGSKKDSTIGWNSKIRSVYDFTDSVTKFDYNASMSISTGNYFNFQTEKGFVELQDNPEKWARYNTKRVYDPRQKKTVIYIFEGMNGTIDRTYTGFLEQKTFVKRSSKQLDTIKLTFKDKFFLWDKVEFTKNMVFENVKPKKLLGELLNINESEIEYINGTVDGDYPSIQSMSTKPYKTYLDFVKDYAKSGVRFSFDGKENLVIFSDTIIDNITPKNDIPINETFNITDITENSKDQFIYNDINAEVLYRRPWKNIDEFGGMDNVDYVKFLGNPIQVSHTLVKVEANMYSNVLGEVKFYNPNAAPLDSYEVTKTYETPSPGEYTGSLLRYDNSKDIQVYRKSSDGTWAWKKVGDSLETGEVEFFDTGETDTYNTGTKYYASGEIIVNIDVYKSKYVGEYEYLWVADGNSINTASNVYYSSQYKYKTNMKRVRRQVRVGYTYSGKLYKEVFDNYSMNILSVTDSTLIDHVTYGDYVLLKDNRANDAHSNEFYGKVSRIFPDEDRVEIAFGNFDKDYRLLYRGKMDWFFATGYNESQNFTLHYGKVELPIIWKYAREFTSGSRDYNLNYPLIPSIISDTDGSIIETGIKETFAVFGFAKDLEDESYSGYATNIDRLWSEVTNSNEANPEFVWFKEDQLKYNRELEQSQDDTLPPLYLLSNTIDKKNFKNGNDSYIEYDYFDNRNIEIGVVVPNNRFLEPDGKESEMKDSDAIVKLKNTNTILESEITTDTPINMMGYSILEVADNSIYSVGDVLRLSKVSRVDYPTGSSYTDAEIAQNEQADFYEGHNKLRWTVTSVFTDADNKEYLQLDMEYPIAVNRLIKYYFKFERFPYDKNVFVQELYIRGNPVVEKTETIKKTNYESVDVYGKKSFTVDANFLTKDDMFRLVDYYYKNFNGLTRDTTKIRIPMAIWYGSIFLDKLDVVEFRDSVFTGIDETTKWMVTKKTPKNIELVNISKYSGDADSIDRNETVVYKPDTLPTYDHTGGDGLNKNNPDTTNKIVSKEDDSLGTLGLVEIPLNVFSAKIDIYAENKNNPNDETHGMITLKNVTGEDSTTVDKYSDMFFGEHGIEYIVKVDNSEFMQIQTTAGTKGFVSYRGLFETDKVNLSRGKIVQFYAIASKVNEYGLSTQALLVGNESGNHLKYSEGELTVVAKNIDMQSGNINVENIVTGDKIRLLSSHVEGQYDNELLIGTAEGSSTNFQIGNSQSNGMLRLNDTRADILLGQKPEGTYQLTVGNPTIDIDDILVVKFNNQYSRFEILNTPGLYTQLTSDQYWRLKNYQRYMHFDGDVFQIGANVELKGFTNVDLDKVSDQNVSISFDDLNKMYVQNTLGMTQLTGNAVKVFQTPESPQLLTSFGYMDASKGIEATEFVRIGKNAVPTFNQDGNRIGYKDGMWIGDLSNVSQDLQNYMTYNAQDGLFIKGNVTLVSTGKRIEDEIGDAVTTVETELGNTISDVETNLGNSIVGVDLKADLALSKISDISSDSKITPVEKESTRRKFMQLESDYETLKEQTIKYGISTVNLTTLYNGLDSYLAPIFADMYVTTDIVNTEFVAQFNNYYLERNDVLILLNKELATHAKWDSVEGTPTLTYARNFAFENGLDGWSYSYEGEIVDDIIDGGNSIVASELGTVGGKVLRVDTEKWIYGADAIPVDVSKTYRLQMKVKIKQTGLVPNKVYLGCACLDTDYKNIVEGVGTHRWAGAYDITLDTVGEWTLLSGYITGTQDKHSSFKTNTSYVRPCILLNYTSDASHGDYIYEVDYVSFEEMNSSDDLKNQAGWELLPSDGATNNSEKLEYSIPTAQLKFGQDALGYDTHGINITAGIGDGDNSKLTKLQIDSYTGNFVLESFGKVNIYNNKNRLYFDDEPDSNLNKSQILLNTNELGDSDVVFRLGDSMTYTKSDVLSFTNGSIALSENKTIDGVNYDFKTILNADTITSNSQSKSSPAQKITQTEGGDIYFSEVNTAGQTYSSRANVKLASGVVSHGEWINLATEHSNGVAWENPQVIVLPLNFDITGSSKYNLSIAWSGNSFKPTATGVANVGACTFQYFAYESAGGAGTKYGAFTTSEKTSSTQSYTFTIPHGFSDIKACYSNLGTVSSWSVSGNSLTVNATGSTSSITKTSSTQSKTLDYAWNDSPAQTSYLSKWLTSPFPATYTGYPAKTGAWSKIYRSGTGSSWTNYTGQPTNTRIVAYSTGEYYSSGAQIGGTWYGGGTDSYEYRNVATGNTYYVHTDKYSLGSYEQRRTAYKTQRRLVGKRWTYSGALKAYTYKYDITYLYVQ